MAHNFRTGAIVKAPAAAGGKKSLDDLFAVAETAPPKPKIVAPPLPPLAPPPPPKPKSKPAPIAAAAAAPAASKPAVGAYPRNGAAASSAAGYGADRNYSTGGYGKGTAAQYYDDSNGFQAYQASRNAPPRSAVPAPAAAPKTGGMTVVKSGAGAKPKAPAADAAGAAAAAALPFSHASYQVPIDSLEELLSYLNAEDATGDGAESVLRGVVRFTNTIRKHAATPATASDATTTSGTSALLLSYIHSSPEATELFAVLDASEGSGFRSASAIIDCFAAIIAAASNAAPSATSASANGDRKSKHSTGTAAIAAAVSASSAGAGGAAGTSSGERLKELRTAAVFIARKLIRQKMKSVYRLLAAEDNRIIQCVLRLLIATVGLGASMGRELIQKFNFGLKSFQRLPHRVTSASSTTHSKSSKSAPAPATGSDSHTVQAQRTRNLFIELALAFLRIGDAELTRSTLAIKGFVSAILKGLPLDPFDIMKSVITTLQHCVLLHPSVSSGVKSSFFNSYVLEQLIKLYEAEESAPLVHVLMTQLVTLRREEDETDGAATTASGDDSAAVTTEDAADAADAEAERQLELSEDKQLHPQRHASSGSGKHKRNAASASGDGADGDAAGGSSGWRSKQELNYHRRTMLRLCCRLKANEDHRQQQLVLTILARFPSLTRPFLRQMPYSFDARLSFRWLANMSLLSKLYGLAVPATALALPASIITSAGAAGAAGALALAATSDDAAVTDDSAFGSSGGSTAPSISGALNAIALTVIEHIFPVTLTKSTLSIAVQHSSLLVRQTTLATLCFMFSRYQQIITAFFGGAAATNAGVASSLSASMRDELRRRLNETFRRHVPEMQIIYALRARISPLTWTAGASAGAAAGKKSKSDPESKQSAKPESDDSGESVTDLVDSIDTRNELYTVWCSLLESYQTLLPDVVLESRIDVWKLLTTDCIAPPQPATASSIPAASLSAAAQFRLISVLRTFGPSDPRLWQKPAASAATAGEKSKPAVAAAAPAGKANAKKRAAPTADGDDQPAADADTASPTSVGGTANTNFGSLLQLYVRCRTLAASPTASPATPTKRASKSGDSKSAPMSDEPPAAAAASQSLSWVHVADLCWEYITDILVHTGLFAAAAKSTAAPIAAAADAAPQQLRLRYHEISVWGNHLSSSSSGTAAAQCLERLVVSAVHHPPAGSVAIGAAQAGVSTLTSAAITMLRARIASEVSADSKHESASGKAHKPKSAASVAAAIATAEDPLIRTYLERVWCDLLHGSVPADRTALAAHIKALFADSHAAAVPAAAAARNKKQRTDSAAAAADPAPGSDWIRAASTGSGDPLLPLFNLIERVLNASAAAFPFGGTAEASRAASTRLDQLLSRGRSVASVWAHALGTETAISLFQLPVVQAATRSADTSDSKSKSAALLDALAAHVPYPLLLSHASAVPHSALRTTPAIAGVLRAALNNSIQRTILSAAPSASSPSGRVLVDRCQMNATFDLVLHALSAVLSLAESNLSAESDAYTTGLLDGLELVFTHPLHSSASHRVSIDSIIATPILRRCFLTSDSASATAIANAVSRAVVRMATHALSASTGDSDSVGLAAVLSPYFQLTVDACSKLFAAAPPSALTTSADSVALPLPLTAAQLFAPHLSPAQMDTLSDSLLPASASVASSELDSKHGAGSKSKSKSKSAAAGAGTASTVWMRALAIHTPALARAILSRSPLRASLLLQRHIQAASSAAAAGSALDQLIYDVLASPASGGSAFSLSVDIDSALFPLLLSALTPVRARLLAVLVRASDLYARRFAAHFRTRTSGDADSQHLLPVFVAYLQSTAARAVVATAESGDADHRSVLDWLAAHTTQLVQWMIAAPTSADSTVASDCLLIVRRLVLGGHITLSSAQQRQQLLIALLQTASAAAAAAESAMSDEKQTKSKSKKAGTAMNVFAVEAGHVIVCPPVQPASGSDTKSAPAASGSIEIVWVYRFVLRALQTLSALLKAGSKSKSSNRSASAGELRMIRVLTDVLQRYSGELTLYGLAAHLLPASKKAAAAADDTELRSAVDTINAFLTSALRYRFLDSRVLRLVRAVLRLHHFPANMSLPTGVSIVNPAQYLVLSKCYAPKLILDLLVSHSLFLAAILPSYNANATNSSAGSSGDASSAGSFVSVATQRTKIELLRLLYALFEFSSKPSKHLPTPSGGSDDATTVALSTSGGGPARGPVRRASSHPHLVRLLCCLYMGTTSRLDSMVYRLLFGVFETEFMKRKAKSEKKLKALEVERNAAKKANKKKAPVVHASRAKPVGYVEPVDEDELAYQHSRAEEERKVKRDSVFRWTRKWGDAARRVLFARLVPASANASALPWANKSMTEVMDGAGMEEGPEALLEGANWIYANFSQNMLSRGPTLVTASGDSDESDDQVPAWDEDVNRNDLPLSLATGTATTEIRYDARFLLPFLFGFVRDHHVPTPAPNADGSTSTAVAIAGSAGSGVASGGASAFSKLDWRKLVDMKLVSYVIMCMSVPDTTVRTHAYALMGFIFTAIAPAPAATPATATAVVPAAAAVAAPAKAAKADAKADAKSDAKPEKAKKKKQHDDGLDEFGNPIGPAGDDDAAYYDENAYAYDDGSAAAGGADGTYYDENGYAYSANDGYEHDQSAAAATVEEETAVTAATPAAAVATTHHLLGFKEQPQIGLALSVLKNAITSPLEVVPPTSTSFIGRVLPLLLRPDHVLYKPINRFLLARPTLDLTDVPMFYGLFNSGADGSYRHHRTWMLRFLTHALQSSVDHTVFARRHVFALLMSFYQSRLADHLTRSLVMSVLSGAVRIDDARTALIHKHGVFVWIRSLLLNESELPVTGLTPVCEFINLLIATINRTNAAGAATVNAAASKSASAAMTDNSKPSAAPLTDAEKQSLSCELSLVAASVISRLSPLAQSLVQHQLQPGASSHSGAGSSYHNQRRVIALQLCRTLSVVISAAASLSSTGSSSAASRSALASVPLRTVASLIRHITTLFPSAEVSDQLFMIATSVPLSDRALFGASAIAAPLPTTLTALWKSLDSATAANSKSKSKKASKPAAAAMKDDDSDDDASGSVAAPIAVATPAAAAALLVSSSSDDESTALCSIVDWCITQLSAQTPRRTAAFVRWIHSLTAASISPAAGTSTRLAIKLIPLFALTRNGGASQSPSADARVLSSLNETVLCLTPSRSASAASAVSKAIELVRPHMHRLGATNSKLTSSAVAVRAWLNEYLALLLPTALSAHASGAWLQYLQLATAPATASTAKKSKSADAAASESGAGAKSDEAAIAMLARHLLPPSA